GAGGADQFHFGSATAYRNRRPTRDEFFWAPGPRFGGPGPAQAETRVDYQDLSTYLEVTLVPWLSGFVEAPYRFLNPEVNGNTSGFADMNAGFKVGLVQAADGLVTFQFRTYVPTGDADRGLGTRHVSLEPALLVNYRLTESWLLEGELRYWVPVGGSTFAGDLIRYGLGVSYGQRCPDRFWLSPVAEVVGWTALGGHALAVRSPQSFAVEDSAGDTIVNFKFGMRFGLGDQGDVYAGYGRA